MCVRRIYHILYILLIYNDIMKRSNLLNICSGSDRIYQNFDKCDCIEYMVHRQLPSSNTKLGTLSCVVIASS